MNEIYACLEKVKNGKKGDLHFSDAWDQWIVGYLFSSGVQSLNGQEIRYNITESMREQTSKTKYICEDFLNKTLENTHQFTYSDF